MFGYFSILGAIPGFFLSSLILMAMWNVVAPKIGVVDSISYVTAMLVTITLWLAVAPLAAAGWKRKK
jgi:positive regulator of sigma E activity